MSNLENSATNLIGNVNTKRVEWIDYAKGIGIVLVVYGHVIIGVSNSGVVEAATTNLQLFTKSSLDFLYCFHMALFFFISGLFVDGRANNSTNDFKNFFWKKVKTIAYPYLVWSIIQGLFYALMSPYTNTKFNILDLPLRIIFIPIAQFWFLYILFAYHIIFVLLKRFFNIYIILFISVILYLISTNYAIEIYVVRGFAERFIYFVLGATTAKFLHEAANKMTNVQCVGLSLAFLCAQISIFFLVSVVLKLYIPREALLGFLLASLGILSTLCLSVYLDRLKVLVFVRHLGSLSMPIYLVHLLGVVATRIFLQKILHINDLLLHIFAATVVGILFPLTLYSIAEKLQFPYLFSPDKRSS